MLWGMSNPDEPPGVAHEFDWDYFDEMRARVADARAGHGELGHPQGWAATIDFTPDHLPILGPLLSADGPVAGTTVAAAGGHGMMWGPAVSRAAADLALTGKPTSSTSPTSASTDSTSTAAAGSPPTRSPCPSPRGPDVTTATDTASAGRLERRRPRGLGSARGGDRRRDAHLGRHLVGGRRRVGGVWECTPGPSRWLLETHEVIHLVAGSDDGHPGRRRAHRGRRRRRRDVPQGLVGHLGHPRAVRKVYAISKMAVCDVESSSRFTVQTPYHRRGTCGGPVGSRTPASHQTALHTGVDLPAPLGTDRGGSATWCHEACRLRRRVRHQAAGRSCDDGTEDFYAHMSERVRSNNGSRPAKSWRGRRLERLRHRLPPALRGRTIPCRQLGLRASWSIPDPRFARAGRYGAHAARPAVRSPTSAR